MSVYSQHAMDGYFMMPNAIVGAVSANALEIYCYIRSKPVNWLVHNSHIKKCLGIKSDHSIAKYFRELIENGWIKRKKLRNKAGQMTGDWAYILNNKSEIIENKEEIKEEDIEKELDDKADLSKNDNSEQSSNTNASTDLSKNDKSAHTLLSKNDSQAKTIDNIKKSYPQSNDTNTSTELSFFDIHNNTYNNTYSNNTNKQTKGVVCGDFESEEEKIKNLLKRNDFFDTEFLDKILSFKKSYAHIEANVNYMNKYTHIKDRISYLTNAVEFNYAKHKDTVILNSQQLELVNKLVKSKVTKERAEFIVKSGKSLEYLDANIKKCIAIFNNKKDIDNYDAFAECLILKKNCADYIEVTEEEARERAVKDQKIKLSHAFLELDSTAQKKLITQVATENNVTLAENVFTHYHDENFKKLCYKYFMNNSSQFLS